MNNLKIKKPVSVKGIVYLVIFAFMVSSIVFIATSGMGTIGIAIRMTTAGLIFIGVLTYLIAKSRHVEAREDSLAIMGLNKEVVEQDATTEMKYRKPMHFDTYPRYFDLSQILNGKANKNIAIIGMSGCGKSQLAYKIIAEMKDYKKIIFQYKNTDRYRELGYPFLKIKEHTPNIFTDKEAFAMAWITAFAIENRGITANQVLPLVRNAVNVSGNWKDFKEEIVKQERKERGTISGSALADIRLKLDSVYSEEQFNSALPDEIVIDFEGLSREAFVFYAEAILRSIFKDMKEGRRNGTMIFVDEAHLFVNTANTIIPELSALIRSRGAFVFATQRASTIAGDIKGNAGTQFCFKQTEEDDIKAVSAISPLLSFAIKELGIHEFIDLGQNGVNDIVFQNELCNPNPAFHKEAEWKPEAKETVKRQRNYYEEIEEMMTTARNVQSIARKIAEEGGDFNAIKRDIIPILKKMVANGDLNVASVENVRISGIGIQNITERPYYKVGTEQLHDYLVKGVADILYIKGIHFKVEPTGRSVADISGLDFVIEVETGNKRSVRDLNERKERYKKDGKSVFVVVPNREVKLAYEGSYTIPEFAVLLNEMEGVEEVAKEAEKNE